jgi:hypothetical protein
MLSRTLFDATDMMPLGPRHKGRLHLLVTLLPMVGDRFCDAVSAARRRIGLLTW